MIVGLAGRAGSGKDTFAKFLSLQDRESYIVHFADSLKEAVRCIFGFTSDQLTDVLLKEEVDPYWGISPRKACQLLGTEGGRNVFGKDLWVKSLSKRISGFPEGSLIVVADMRFDEEFSLVRSMGGVTILLQRPITTTALTTHSSETSLDHLKEDDWDFVIQNSGSFDDLCKRAREVYAAIKETYVSLGATNESSGVSCSSSSLFSSS